MGTYHLASELGVLGEELGCRYLRDKGYVIVEKNYCNAVGRRIGEIDIVAQRNGELVFVEVKCRVSDATGDTLPEVAITRQKLRKLERIAQCYLRDRRCLEKSYHFDAVAIMYNESTKKALIRHLEYIFF